MTVIMHPSNDFYPLGPLGPPPAKSPAKAPDAQSYLPPVWNVIDLWRTEKLLADRFHELTYTMSNDHPDAERTWAAFEGYHDRLNCRREQLMAALDRDYGPRMGSLIAQVFG